MRGPTNETVGINFSEDSLIIARDKTLEVITKAAQLTKAGMKESEARKMIQELQQAVGAPKSWHPPQIRFGENTTLGFGAKGIEDAVLAEDDIFFFDIGPLFGDHEGDVGRSFSIGNNPEMKKCCHDVEKIWKEVRDHWKNHHVTGAELYEFAKESAKKRGWVLALEKANGHRISDFPHAAKMRGSIEEFSQRPAANRWILEIQIRHPHKPFGAFYEDLLN